MVITEFCAQQLYMVQMDLEKVILSVLCRSYVIWSAIVLIISRGKEYFRCVIN